MPEGLPPADAGLLIGDVLPTFRLANQRGGTSDLLHLTQGRAILVCLVPPGQETPRALLAALARHRERLAALAHFFVITAADPAANAALATELDLLAPVLSDAAGATATAWGLAPEAAVTLVLADANRRVLRIERGPPGPDTVAALLADLEARPAAEPVEVRPAAPVLYVPRVLDPGQCEQLIRLYHEGGNAPSGVFRGGARPAGGDMDGTTKQRRDHIVQDPATARGLGRLIGRRVVPEMKKAFGFEAKFVKEFKIGCYGAADRGFFRAHRDNYGDPQGRAFAMTLNLNAGAYEGGHLTFPEYGPELYRPATGDAVIFSCALLHEAQPVTAGERFVLLSFFYGAAAEAEGA